MPARYVILYYVKRAMPKVGPLNLARRREMPPHTPGGGSARDQHGSWAFGLARPAPVSAPTLREE